MQRKGGWKREGQCLDVQESEGNHSFLEALVSLSFSGGSFHVSCKLSELVGDLDIIKQRKKAEKDKRHSCHLACMVSESSF